MEAANQEIDGRPIGSLGEDGRPKLQQGFGEISPRYIFTPRSRISYSPLLCAAELTKTWIEDNLDIYKAWISTHQTIASVY
jgi:hypothetical protein